MLIKLVLQMANLRALQKATKCMSFIEPAFPTRKRTEELANQNLNGTYGEKDKEEEETTSRSNQA